MQRKYLGAAAALALLATGTGGALAAKSAPKKVTVKAVSHIQFKINRYVKDGLRWNKDTYTVKSGGTVKLVQLASDDGPHTFSIVKKKDLPRTTKQIGQCKVCEAIGQALGADPNSDAPPAHFFAENGVGQDTAPNVDRAGDTAFFGADPSTKTVSLKVTAKKGTTLYFICAIHPWMQGKLKVR